MTTSLVLRFAARDWRSGELRLLLAALLLAVGAVSAISLFVDRLHRALVAESTSFLAADRVIDSSREIPESFRELARQEALEVADLITFPSIVAAKTATPKRKAKTSPRPIKQARKRKGSHPPAIRCAACCAPRNSRLRPARS